MMRIRMTSDCGWYDGLRLEAGGIVDLPDIVANDYVALGLAEPVAEVREAAVEAAVVEPPENAAARTIRTRRRRRT